MVRDFPLWAITRKIAHLIRLSGAQDEVHAALRIDDATDLAHPQRKRRILERLLHLPRSKPAQVSIVVVGRTVRVLAREHAKLVRAPPDLRFVSFQDRDGLFLRACDVGLPKKIST